jgi:hypothetical protein
MPHVHFAPVAVLPLDLSGSCRKADLLGESAKRRRVPSSAAHGALNKLPCQASAVIVCKNVIGDLLYTFSREPFAEV